jgi:BolA protein
MRMSLLKRVRGFVGAMRRLWGGRGEKQEKEFLDLKAVAINPPRMRVAESIQAKLAAAFAPSVLEVIDESARHAGHAGAARADGEIGETHFQVRMVSSAFEGVSRVERQRRVHAALAQELAGSVHALSLKLQTPAEANN